MIKRTLSTVTLLLSMTISISEGARLTDSQLAELPDSTQKFVLFIRNITDKGGKGIKSMSFKDTEYKFAITTIYDNSTDAPLHMTSVLSDGNEASIGFKIFKKCDITRPGDSLVNRIIRVDGTNISTVMGCGKDSSDPSVTQEVFVLKTQAGKNYVQRQFSENPFVFVDFGSGEIPFDTDGFNELWQRADEPAL